MRRLLIPFLVAGLLALGAMPASAGDGDSSVRPDPVELGEKLKMKAFDCESGDGWVAVVEISIIELEDGEEVDEVYFKEIEADDDGETTKRLTVKKPRFHKGRYLVRIDCIHHFVDGGTGIWYESEHEIRVKRAS